MQWLAMKWPTDKRASDKNAVLANEHEALESKLTRNTEKHAHI